MLRNNSRRLDVARSWQRAREAYASVVAERDALKRELAWTRQSLDEIRAASAELRAAVLARQKAEAELASLYRERAISARATDRARPDSAAQLRCGTGAAPSFSSMRSRDRGPMRSSTDTS